MARQSISISKLNDEWLKAQIEKEEYSSKSELVNDLNQSLNNDRQPDSLALPTSPPKALAG